MKPIAIITATPPGINPGMLAGEAAARATLSRAGLLPQTTFFRLVTLEERLSAVGDGVGDVLGACDVGVRHVALTDPAILDDHVPLFWADFLHMRRYITALAQGDPGREAAFRGVLLLADRPEATVRAAVSYGTSLLFNSTADDADPVYGPVLRRFLGAAGHVQMRDAISAVRVAGSRPAPAEACGIDPAQLMALPAVAEALLAGLVCDGTEQALVFFARGQHRPDDVVGFVGELTAATGVGCRWLPWGDRLSFPFGEPAIWPWPTVDLPPAPAGAGVLPRLLAAIQGSRFVVTDTYHAAVSSWALGVPAVVLTGTYHDAERAAKGVDLRVRVDKRTVLLAQDGLLDFCIEPSLIATAEGRTAVATRLAAPLMDGAIGPAFRAALATRAARSEESLLAALDASMAPV